MITASTRSQHNPEGGNETITTVKVQVEKTYDIKDDIIDVIIEMAGYGINYWATEMSSDDHKRIVKVWDMDPPEDGPYIVTYSKLLEALVHIGTRNSPNYVDQYAQRTLREIEDGDQYPGGDIDADLADVIVQWAIFGEVIYG